MAETNAETERTARFSHIFARLQDLHNYVWDPEVEPFHSVSSSKCFCACAKLTRA
jgi:hypothetical protein